MRTIIQQEFSKGNSSLNVEMNEKETNKAKQTKEKETKRVENCTQLMRKSQVATMRLDCRNSTYVSITLPDAMALQCIWQIAPVVKCDVLRRISKAFGVTDFINPNETEETVQQIIKRMTDGGVDYSFECIGDTEMVTTALQSCCDVSFLNPSKSSRIFHKKTHSYGILLLVLWDLRVISVL
ncbi:hypothetical protein E3N88_28867 [Mikania micrantha]|uniref:Alcohol dehydrogenase-like C-terminal domain-containing protein n=1 Tax=Mikania micrantha TaxID=192012 RepID=A0A5N6N1P4_9ASTR|nr:hypothetical protein E3N88_28867 [Mikania micrantha]